MNPEVSIYKRQVAEVMAKGKACQRVVRFFPETDLRNGHEGLGQIAKKQNVKVSTLGKGEYVLFTNKRLTGCKLFAPGNIVAYLKMPDNTRIDPRTIALIPRFFDGSKINYDAALTEVLKKEFKIQDL